MIAASPNMRGKLNFKIIFHTLPVFSKIIWKFRIATRGKNDVGNNQNVFLYSPNVKKIQRECSNFEFGTGAFVQSYLQHIPEGLHCLINTNIDPELKLSMLEHNLFAKFNIAFYGINTAFIIIPLIHN